MIELLVWASVAVADRVDELGGIYIGQSVAEASDVLNRRGGQLVRVTELTFREPYVLYNLVNDGGEIYGNIGVCREHVANVTLSVGGYANLMTVLRQRLGQYGQPKIEFTMSEAMDGSTAFPNVLFSWPNGYDLSFPADERDHMIGAQMVSNGKPCR